MKIAPLLFVFLLLFACSSERDDLTSDLCIPNGQITGIGEFPGGFTAEVIRVSAEEALALPGKVRHFSLIDSTLFLSQPYPGGKIVAVGASNRVLWTKENGEHPIEGYASLRKLIGDPVGKTLRVYDDRSRKRFTYDLDGAFIDYEPFPYYFSDVAEVDGEILVNLSGYLNEEFGDSEEHKVEIIKLEEPDGEGRVVSYAPYYDKKEVVYLDDLDFAVDATSDKIFFSRNYGDTLFQLTDSGISPYQVFCFENNDIREETRKLPDVRDVIQVYLDENIPY